MARFFIKKEEGEKGYILAFALVVLAALLLVSLSVSRIMAKEMFFSRIVDFNKGAYFAANSGVECAIYLDSVIKDENKALSVILSNTNGNLNTKIDFEENLNQNILFSTSTVKNITTINDIVCASDGSYNQIFANNPDADSVGYLESREGVIQALESEKSSYTIIGDGDSATTTFGLVLRQVDPNDEDNTIFRCVLVDFAKKESTFSPGVASEWSITANGFSSCKGTSQSRVSRTIYRYSSD